MLGGDDNQFPNASTTVPSNTNIQSHPQKGRHQKYKRFNKIIGGPQRSSSYASNQGNKHDRRYRAPCRFFTSDNTSSCRYGTNCRFAHTNPKDNIRINVWLTMERHNLVNNSPLFGITRTEIINRRIPSFIGADEACHRLAQLPEFQSASVVKVHPSLSATRLRQLVLENGKQLLVPPLPKNDFLYYLLDPTTIPQNLFRKVSSRSGWQRHGMALRTLASIPPIDVVVVATVAVDMTTGARLGKGKGYGEIEYGICRDVGVVDDDTIVATIVHDCQVVDDMMDLASTQCGGLAKHDLPVDIICTPTRVIYTNTMLEKPTGIIWGLITSEMMLDIGVLKDLASIKGFNNIK